MTAVYTFNIDMTAVYVDIGAQLHVDKAIRTTVSKSSAHTPLSQTAVISMLNV